MDTFPASLLRGYRAFRGGRYAREQGRYRALAEHGQAPEAMVIACCDSRTAPETVFDAAPGEIFAVRNVANLVSPCEPGGACNAASAALEFAVHGLKVKHIVVLGHSLCGGVRAALRPEEGPLSEADFIGKWVQPLRLLADSITPGGGTSEAERQTALERASIRHSLANLRTFPWIAALEDSGRLGLHGAWFDIASGELWTMDPADGRFSKAG